MHISSVGIIFELITYTNSLVRSDEKLFYILFLHFVCHFMQLEKGTKK